MRKLAVLILIPSLSFAAAVQAADQMKPGLWEMTMKSDMMKNMPKIPPEQMEQMRQMGMNVPQMQDGGMVTKVCISKEMAEREQPPVTNTEAGCETRNYHRSGNSYSIDIVCDGANMKGEGTAKGSFRGNESFSSTYDFKGTARGKPVSQHNETSGKWIGAACGDVKPMADVPHKRK